MSAIGTSLRAAWADRVVTAVARVVGTRGVVLCFHGFDADGAPASSSMHVPVDLLEAVVDTIQRLGTMVPLSDLVTRHLAGHRTAGLIALTADDAYDSLAVAEPFLKRSSLPITVFAVSDALISGRRFWWDRIDESAPRTHPERWRRFEQECGVPDTYRQGQPSSEGPARPLRQWVLAEHAGRWPEALETTLDRLERDLNWRTVQRSMTAAELEGFLARTGGELGIHTCSHAALPFLPDAEIVDEIRRCHDALRARFRHVVPYLAVPFGLFDARTLRLAAQAGMTVSLTLAGTPLDRPFVADIGMPRLCVVREHRPGILTLKASAVSGLISRLRGRPGSPYPVLPSATS
jgi:peptidoglycan/xylan/chitin deacetylase (PgdA/CDA1 family)